jgi:hypothetical protein
MHKFRTADILSAIILVLAAAASAGGLLLAGLYRDNDLVRSAWLGNDLVTLVVAVPVLAASLAFARRGSPRARLVQLGMLDYMLYNYAFYLFGAAFNSLFLIYTALFTLAIFALISGLLDLDVGLIAGRIRPRASFRWVSGWMVFVALGLTAVYLIQSLQFIATAALPAIVVATGHPTSVVFALDLSLVVPVLLLGAVWLWQRRPWGYVLAAVVNVKGAVYMLALSGATAASFQFGFLEDPSQIVLWLVLGAGSLLAVLRLLRNLDAIQPRSPGIRG